MTYETASTVFRVVRELHRLKRRYRLFLRPLDGIGSTPTVNSSALIREADAVLAVVSVEYLNRAMDGNRFINVEVGEMLGRSRDVPIVPVGVDSRDALLSVPKWNWGQMCHDWRDHDVVLSNDFPLKDASEEIIRTAVEEALKYIDNWRKKP